MAAKRWMSGKEYVPGRERALHSGDAGGTINSKASCLKQDHPNRHELHFIPLCSRTLATGSGNDVDQFGQQALKCLHGRRAEL